MPRFTRRKEDFECGHCGNVVVGDGYTNHCPKCLWSKHVDIHPGDREETCGGLMEPVGVRVHRDGYDLEHRCTRCGTARFCRTSPQDDFEMVLKVSKKVM